MKYIEQLEAVALEGYVFPSELMHTREIRELWNQKLHLAYGPQALKLCKAVYGSFGKIEEFVRLVALAPGLTRRLEEQPVMMPFLRDFIALQTCPSDFAKVKLWLEKRGLNPSTWRALTQLPQGEFVDVLAMNLSSAGYFLTWLNLLSQATNGQLQYLLPFFSEGRPRGFAHYEHMLQADNRGDVVVQIQRLFNLFNKQLKTSPREFHQRHFDLLEGLAASLYPDLLAGNEVVVKNSTINSIHRQMAEQQARADATARAKALAAEKIVFPAPPLEQIQLGSFHWKFLPDVPALVHEGFSMQHCVKDEGYWHRCAKGESLIYHVEHVDNPSVCATAEFSRTPNGYIISQIKGKANSMPVPVILEQGRKLTEQLNS